MSYYFQTNSWGECYIPEVNRDSFTQERSSTVYDKRLDLELSASNTLYVIVGSDSGLLLNYLQAQTLPEGSSVAIIEEDSVYPYVLDRPQNEITPPVNQNNSACVNVYSASHWTDHVFDGNDKEWILGGQVRLIQASCCMTDYLQRYLPLYRDVRLALDERRTDLLQRCGSKPFIQAQVINAADNVSAFQTDGELGRDKVAVVLGAGSSLDQHLNWLKNNQEKLFIIAASRLCSKLQSIDLMPDIVVSIDPQEYLYEVSKQGTAWVDVPLVHSHYVASRLLQQWRGPHYYIGERLPWDNVDEKSSNTGYTGTTVSHTAVAIAARLGFSTILMAGVDLCFSVTGDTHASGSLEAAMSMLPGQYDTQVETYDGRLVGTSMVLHRSLSDMADLGALINRESPALFNLSASAARVNTISLTDKFGVALPTKAPKYSAKPFEPTLISLHNLQQQLDRSQVLFQAIATVCKGEVEHGVYDDDFDEVSVSNILDSLVASLSDTGIEPRAYVKAIELHAAYEFAQLRKPSDSMDGSNQDRNAFIRQCLDIVQSSCRDFAALIDAARGKVELRQYELQNYSDVCNLIEHWRVDKTPGRVLAHSDRYSQQFSTEQLSVVDDAVQAYLQTLLADVNMDNLGIAHEVSSIERCVNSVVFLFNQHNVTDLELLSSAITDNTWSSNAVRALIDAFTCEIELDKIKALARYQSLIDLCSNALCEENVDTVGVHRLLEEALTHMTQLYLGSDDAQSAMTALATLCEFCPHYIGSYAELLSVVGEVDQAVELLVMYLENYPEDWRAAQQLAELHQSRGAEEEAKVAFEQARSAIGNHAHHQKKVA